MIDIAKLRYRVILMTETGEQLNVTDFVENLGWEDNHGELAVRITLTLSNQSLHGTPISNYAKLNCLIAVFVEHEGRSEEVVRGRIVEWETSTANNQNRLQLTCYDNLYDLQNSQDCIYYSAGTRTKTALMGIFSDWGIPIAQYEGPDVTHEKQLVYNAIDLSEIILEILEDAEKKGADKYIIRCSKGEISICKRGSNQPVYHFGEDNSIYISNKLSTADLVTRVKVIGQSNEEEKASVEAVVDGKTEYGIRQKIIVSKKDASIDSAKSEAQKEIDKHGDVKRTMSVQGPDVPFIRKGDLVHVTAGTLDGYYHVSGIQHNADIAEMSMSLEMAD